MSFVLKKRVFQISATAYAVESKKFLKTLNKPSKLHIVQRRLNSLPYDLMCDCIHAGVRPSPFDCCSHILAVFIATTLKDGDLSLLAMRDDARRKEQEKKQEVPIVGNEYPAHTSQKKRVYELLKADGWEPHYEATFYTFDEEKGEINKYPYSLDVGASKEVATQAFGHERIMIGVEINREGTGGGHGTKITIAKDKKRAQEMFEQHRVIIIPFNISHMRAATDEMILEEIYQRIGI